MTMTDYVFYRYSVNDFPHAKTDKEDKVGTPATVGTVSLFDGSFFIAPIPKLFQMKLTVLGSRIQIFTRASGFGY